MPTYYIWTIGCQMNRAESDRLAGRFEELGYTPVDKPGEAELIVVNSCVVRQSAEDRAVNKLDNLRMVKKINPLARIALTGCMVGEDADKLHKRFPYVDWFFQPGEAPPWLDGPTTNRLPAKVKVSETVSWAPAARATAATASPRRRAKGSPVR